MHGAKNDNTPAPNTTIGKKAVVSTLIPPLQLTIFLLLTKKVRNTSEMINIHIKLKKTTLKCHNSGKVKLFEE
jgi:hypothetical protein